MLYKFKSRNTGDVIMLEASGRRVLEIIGKDAGPKGIILVSEMPSAMDALRAAVAEDERQRAEHSEEVNAGAQPIGGDGVSLKQRALPFLEMLQRCHQGGDEIVWGV